MKDFELDLATIRKLRELNSNKIRMVFKIIRTHYESSTNH